MPAGKPKTFDARRAALLLVDLQNEIIHPEGAYRRSGLASADVQSLPTRLKPLCDAVRAAGGCIVSTHFTVLSGRGGEPLIPEPIRRQRPFIGKGHFVPGTWGHRLIDGLPNPDFEIEKISYSAFYMTRLEWVLRQSGLETLLIAGLSTPSSISSTVRDAVLRDFRVIVIEDGCAAYEPGAHCSALSDLAGIASLQSIRETIDSIRKAAPATPARS
jgi:nicotinamidase-related amidase